MIELNKKQIHELLPKFTGQTALELQFALELQYVYNEENPFGSLPGVPVYSDNIENPNIVLMGSPGYMHLFGNAANFEDENALFDVVKCLYANSDKKIFFNLYAPDWEYKLSKIYDGYKKEVWTRHNYRLDKALFNQYNDWRNKIPIGFTMQYFDVLSDEFLDKHNKERDFWFPQSKRFGQALLKDNEIICECHSVYYEKESYNADVARVVEIGIETKDEYRRQGFACLTATAFIEHCLSRNLEPNWGHWHFNPESCALALKLGFKEISQRRAILFTPEQ